jgi:hypothetical protein
MSSPAGQPSLWMQFAPIESTLTQEKITTPHLMAPFLLIRDLRNVAFTQAVPVVIVKAALRTKSMPGSVSGQAHAVLDQVLGRMEPDIVERFATAMELI